MTTLTPTPKQQFVDANGNPLAGGKVYTYAAGTTTPLATYTDQSGSTPNTNPVILDSRGEAAIWLGAASYKLKLTTATDVEIWTVDNILSSGAQALADLSAPSGSSLVGFLQSGANAVARTVQSKLYDLVSVKDFGANGNNTGNDTPEILASQKPYVFPRGVYRLESSIKYQKDSLWFGNGKSFFGSVLLPTGNFPALEPDTSVAIDYTKNDFSNLQIDASNISSDYAIKINNAYLTNYQNIWVRNSYNGISITNSDAINFHNLMVMENSNNYAVFIGDNARSIKFFGCNFEKNPGNSNPGATVLINGTGVTASSAFFYGCQIERGFLNVLKGSAYWDGGKITDTRVNFNKESQNCSFNAQIFGSTSIFDVGYNNIVQNVLCTNMWTPKHQWPELPVASAGTFTYGTGGDEYTFLVTAGRVANTAGTNCVIEIKEGATALATSPTFNLQAQGNTVGQQAKDTYTFLATVRNSVSGSGPIFTNCNLFGIKGGKNLLTNGTFNGGASTGWSFNTSSGAVSGDDLVITPSGSNWGIWQTISSNLKIGKRYIAVAKFSGVANLCLGDAWDGTVGQRILIDTGVSDVYDTDKIAMLSFEYKGTSRISLGYIGSSSAVTVRWISIIEC